MGKKSKKSDNKSNKSDEESSGNSKPSDEVMNLSFINNFRKILCQKMLKTIKQ